MKIAPYWENGKAELLGMIFVHAPNGEPLSVSVMRLERAIKHDRLADMFTPLTVDYAYTHHPELSRDYQEVVAEWKERRNRREPSFDHEKHLQEWLRMRKEAAERKREECQKK